MCGCVFLGRGEGRGGGRGLGAVSAFAKNRLKERGFSGWHLSQTHPSLVKTGRFIITKVIGQMNSGGVDGSSSLAPPWSDRARAHEHRALGLQVATSHWRRSFRVRIGGLEANAWVAEAAAMHCARESGPTLTARYSRYPPTPTAPTPRASSHRSGVLMPFFNKGRFRGREERLGRFQKLTKKKDQVRAATLAQYRLSADTPRPHSVVRPAYTPPASQSAIG